MTIPGGGTAAYPHMEHTIGNRQLQFDKTIRDKPALRLSFDALLRATFGLSFENWYHAGYWSDAYQPYTLSFEGRVVASAAVSRIDTIWQGHKRRYIQLGTVMTALDFRHHGLQRFLLWQIFADWLNRCDAMYLYANDSVLDFYPKFGFVKAYEYQSGFTLKPRPQLARKLDMDNASDLEILHTHYQKSNPFSALPLLDNWGLIMFYCSNFLKDAVYYSEERSAVVIAEQDGEVLLIYDIFADPGITLEEAAGAVPGASDAGCDVRLGFAPKDAPPSGASPLKEDDTTLFVLAEKENIFKMHKTMLPLLSRA